VGELVAAGPEGLWLFTGPEAIAGATGSHRRIARRHHEDPAEHRLVPAAAIRRVVVSRYHAGPALAITGGWAGGLVLLTVTHGFFLIFTMPITAAAGAGALVGTHVQSKVYVHRGLGPRRAGLGERLSALRGLARFPQGVPSGWPNAAAVPADGPAVEDTGTTGTMPEPTTTDEGDTTRGDEDGDAGVETETDAVDASDTDPVEVPEPPAP
jgi:hypothetical protein